MLSGLPDLSVPVTATSGAAYLGFGRAGVVVAVPDRLRLEADRDGRPRLLLTLIRGGGTVASTGGRLELGLSVESDLEEVGRAMVAQGTPASLSVADLERGILSIDVLLGPLVRTSLAPPQIIPPDLLTRMRVMIELSAEAAVIASRAIDDATLPVVATLRLVFRAVAPRFPLVAAYNPRAVAERLAARLGDGRTVAFSEFESAIETLLGGQEISVEGDLQSLDLPQCARTAALRLRDRFTRPAASDPGKLTLIPAQSVPSGRERIDFAEPAVVVVEQSITIDPLSAARSMRRGAVDDLVRRVEIPPVPTGRQRLVLSANLPEPIAGLQTLVADFRAAPLPPFRPLAMLASVSLDSAERRGETELTLAPGEQLSGEVRLRAVVLRGQEVVEIAGPWREIQQASALLGPSDFGTRLIVLRASPALTALAAVEALAGGVTIARLDAATPVTAVPLGAESLRIVARPFGEGRDIEVELGAKQRLDLDPATLPGFGAHHAQLVADEAKPFVVEWRAEGDEHEAPLTIRMGAGRTVAEIGWIAASPFRPGVVWRAVRNGIPEPWSAPVLPGDGLVIEVGGRTPMQEHEELVIDGITMEARSDDGRVWSYMPPHPTLELGPGGTPMLTVIEAGSTAFLQCTAQVGLNEGVRSALLARLKEAKPRAESLEAAPIVVERIALEAKTGNEWLTVAESKGSGMPPWTAALGATLESGTLAAIKGAVAGEADRARLKAWILLPGTPATFRRSQSAGERRVETPTGAMSASFTATADASTRAAAATALELSADISRLFQKTGSDH